MLKTSEVFHEIDLDQNLGGLVESREKKISTIYGSGNIFVCMARVVNQPKRSEEQPNKA